MHTRCFRLEWQQRNCLPRWFHSLDWSPWLFREAFSHNQYRIPPFSETRYLATTPGSKERSHVKKRPHYWYQMLRAPKWQKYYKKSNRSSVWFIFPERKWGIGSSCYQCETQIQLNGSQMLLARESQHPRKPSNILREWILDLRTDWSSQNFQPPWECSQGKQSSVHKTSIHLSPPVYSLCPISGIILTFQPHFRHRSDAK